MISGAPEDAIFAIAEALSATYVIDADVSEDDISWAAVHVAAELIKLGYAVCATRESTPKGLRDLFLELAEHLPSDDSQRFEFAWPFISISGGVLLGLNAVELMDKEHGRGEW